MLTNPNEGPQDEEERPHQRRRRNPATPSRSCRQRRNNAALHTDADERNQQLVEEEEEIRPWRRRWCNTITERTERFPQRAESRGTASCSTSV